MRSSRELVLVLKVFSLSGWHSFGICGANGQ